MPRYFVKSNQIQCNTITIIGEDVRHIRNVLRKQIDDIIEICDQDNNKSYICKITELKDDQIISEIIDELIEERNNIKVDIYQGLPKSDKMELIIQKSIELGANSIIPVRMKRCVVKIEKKDENKKIERWQKISESAAKQCGRNFIPEIKQIVSIEDIVKLKQNYDEIIVAYENARDNKLKDVLIEIKKTKKKDNEIKIAIVIGPEGGLEDEDVRLLEQNGAKIITLGTRILRTETVALNMLSIIMYELDNT